MQKPKVITKWLSAGMWAKQRIQVLVATHETQGQKPGDFCYVPEGEMVIVTEICSSGEHGSSCGCERSVSGVKCLKATTTFRVEEIEGTFGDVVEIELQMLRRGKWHLMCPPKELQEMAITKAAITCDVAFDFPIGTVLGRKMSDFYVRKYP